MRAAAEDGATLDGSLRRMSPRYGEIHVPVAIVVGDADRIVSAEEHSFRLHAALPHSTLAVLPGTGHQIPVVRPEAVVDAIRSVAGGVGAYREVA